ncbi:hypothetical protein [Methyloversatilis thermotolerans]|uniref:hypothetical protein n=1 Tax=Methyloversatilis thermotolerans TaxID=1346290 RepID=UPI00037719F4|nr:hypothetical protein [Methyloversatilis thermotolerans]
MSNPPVSGRITRVAALLSVALAASWALAHEGVHPDPHIAPALLAQPDDHCGVRTDAAPACGAANAHGQVKPGQDADAAHGRPHHDPRQHGGRQTPLG